MKQPPLGRLLALLVAFLLAMLGVVFRLTVLQVGQATTLRARGLEQRVRQVTLPATRGKILDRQREALALSLPARDVYADPRYVTDPTAEAAKLAPVLGVHPRSLIRPMSSNTTFSYLARQVDLRTANKISAMHLPGIQLLPTSRRSYPAGALAPQVLGFVGIDGTGLAGLEYQYQSLLAGTNGHLTEQVDAAGQPIVQSVTVDRPPQPGQSLVTTIDRDLQYQVQSALEQEVKASHAKGGTVIVMDPRTGDILAMASYPWFNPNDPQASPANVVGSNPAVVDAFEPGSVNKIITAAAAVQERAIGLNRRLVIPDTYRTDGVVIHDAEHHPTLQMTLGDIIAESSNIGAVKVAALVGQETFASYLARFGFGQPTGLGFPGESGGILPPLYQWTPSSMATIPFGQGIAVTPLQMISVYATIANAGLWVQPRLVRGTIDSSGTFQPAPASPTRRVVSEGTARTVSQMLAYVVRSGTGVNAQIAGYQVAGKTGTARIPDPNRAGYLHRYIASFIGFLPASSPRVVVAAILDQPTTAIYGGLVSAPLFQQIARYAIQRLRIAPSAKVPLPPHALPLK